jgi:uncharacterized protein (DUF433 family)
MRRRLPALANAEMTMGRYPLNLPVDLKRAAERFASEQGVSLNQFILWAVAEKVGGLTQQLDDPAFPHVTYRRGPAGEPVAMLRGTGLRVQSVVVAVRHWGLTPQRIAEEYDVQEEQVREALAFYEAHRREIDASLAMDSALEPADA